MEVLEEYILLKYPLIEDVDFAVELLVPEQSLKFKVT
jgi:hypothetical protein